MKRAFHDNNEIWNNGQKGLALACFNINRNNPHIKVYTSIRHEAFAAFRDEEGMAMKSSVLHLRYEFDQLKDIFEQAIKVYENADSVESFIGSDYIPNARIKSQKENPFEYIYRHTIYTPRSLMAAGAAISAKVDKHDKDRVEKVRRVVNSESSEIVVKDYFEGEMMEFLSELKNEEKISRFFALVNKNIMTYDNLVSISETYNKLHVTEKPSEESHPFYDLFNIGLIGLVKLDNVKNARIQSFKQPYEFDWKMNHILPTNSDTYFLIHPSLNQFILQQNPTYTIHSKIVIGNGYEWKTRYDKELEGNKVKIFISYSSYDTIKVNHVSERIRDEMNLRGVYYSSFRDTWSLRGGEVVNENISKAIDECNILLLMLSKESIESTWVEKEWKMKYKNEIKDRNIKVIGVVLDDTSHEKFPILLRRKMAIKLFNGSDFIEKNFRKLIADIILLCVKGENSETPANT